MGYGEFGGGGSVHWRVRHGGGPGGGAGRDPNPPEPSGIFEVWVDGALVATTEVHYGRVVVVWGDDVAALSNPKNQSQAQQKRRIAETTPQERGESNNQ